MSQKYSAAGVGGTPARWISAMGGADIFSRTGMAASESARKGNSENVPEVIVNTSLQVSAVTMVNTELARIDSRGGGKPCSSKIWPNSAVARSVIDVVSQSACSRSFSDRDFASGCPFLPSTTRGG